MDYSHECQEFYNARYMTESILHTEMIERYYGPVTIEIVEQNAERRIINMRDRNGFCRTHAVTWFPPVNKHDPLSEIRERVFGGEGVGRVVKGMGLTIEKEMIYSGDIEVTEKTQNIIDDLELAINLYNFWVVSTDARDLYGTILEIYPKKLSQSCCEMKNVDFTEKMKVTIEYLVST